MSEEQSLVAATQRQAAIMLRLAQQCETQGFCVMVTGMNREGKDNRRLYNYFSGGFGQYVADWARNYGNKYVIVRVSMTDKYPFLISRWHFDLPRTRKFRAIVVALELMANKRSGGNKYRVVTGPGIMTSTEYSDRFAFSGETRDSLEAAIGVLSMEHHREIMTANYL